MKRRCRHFTIVLILIFMCILSICFSACKNNDIEERDVCESGDFIYTIDSSGGTATIVGLTKSGREKTELVIPESIDGYSVTEFGTYVHYLFKKYVNYFSYNEKALGVARVEKIITSKAVSFINWDSFEKGLPNLKYIIVENTNAYIYGRHASSQSTMFVVAPKNTHFEKNYAFAHGIQTPSPANVAFDLNYPQISAEKLSEFSVKIENDIRSSVLSETEYNKILTESELILSKGKEWDKLSYEDKMDCLSKSIEVYGTWDPMIEKVLAFVVEEVRQGNVDGEKDEILNSAWNVVKEDLSGLKSYQDYIIGYENKIEDRKNTAKNEIIRKTAPPNNGYAWIDFLDKGDKLTVPQAPQNITIDATLIEKYPSIFSDYTYSFDGWYLDKECSLGVDVTTYIMTDEPVTFYAKWNKVDTVS